MNKQCREEKNFCQEIMKRCLNSPLVQEMQFKVTMRYHTPPCQTGKKCKRAITAMAGWDLEKGYFHL